MSDCKAILKQYWGFDDFRHPQDVIINSIMEGKDTLGLMPTGGGKSITFQVPALAKEGLCIVITPLIALMKDQVENLQNRKIKAISIHSGLSRYEIDIALDNCIFGGVKFLYVSPERLETDIFRIRVEKMNVNLIAVDESHCISQWGYDFRPSYLKIIHLRELLPDVPVLALTATATPEVVIDIQEKLGFRKKNVVKVSFARKNLAYIVKETEDKMKYLAKVANKTPGSGIIYVRNRKKTKDTALLLQQMGINADYYHAGLTSQLRSQKQDEWKNGKLRIIVATNAFGMGIDKPDVRFVVHIDLPDNLEAYFQEAGRAGRDGKKAWAVVLYCAADVASLNQRMVVNFPDIATIKSVYQALGNYFQVPVGGSKGEVFDFDLHDFCTRYHFNFTIAYSALKTLESEGYIQLTEDLNIPSRVYFPGSRDDLYKYQVANESMDGFIKLLLRSYTGLFSGFTPIDEQVLARRSSLSPDEVYKYLVKLSSQNIIHYIPRRKNPVVFYLEERLDDKNLRITPENYQVKKDRYLKRIDAIKDYVSHNECRSRLLLAYFGEIKTQLCGVCDYCLSMRDTDITNYEFYSVSEPMMEYLKKNHAKIDELVSHIDSKVNEDKILMVIQWHLDNNSLRYDDNGQIMLNDR